VKLSLSASLLDRGVESWHDPDRRETVLTEPCTWCGRCVKTRISDRTLVVTHDMRSVVLDRLIASRVDHLAVERCATAGHDPGDEDPDEAYARLAWRPA